jgi:hypothetical protein
LIIVALATRELSLVLGQQRQAAEQLQRLGVKQIARQQQEALAQFRTMNVASLVKAQQEALAQFRTMNVASLVKAQQEALTLLGTVDFRAVPTTPGSWSDPTAEEVTVQGLATFWAWWVNLTPAQRAVQNSVLGALLAACYLVHIFVPNRTAEVLLGSATLVHAVLLLLSAIEDTRE